MRVINSQVRSDEAAGGFTMDMDLEEGKRRRLRDAYRFKGFSPQDGKLRGIFGEPQARILPMKRRSKKHAVESVAQLISDGMTAR
jgi:hypothetical protein